MVGRLVSFHGQTSQPANKKPDQFNLLILVTVFPPRITKNPLKNQGVIAGSV
jgi:hypothetical protein